MRSRDDSGRYRHKRADTLTGQFEKRYSPDFGVRSDLRLETQRRLYDKEPLTPMIREQQLKEE
ncbi:hypothetical protein C2I18_23340 [Paenibacillus sp. PK3_47]|uniref:hypothetical protein n=1 Tax=Paenibacillus sp. PK3_47 TaxID=2072642 RepID=UPI00201D5FE3|nr:hypothetical protein [Paenibacillus sp. PK3_47]UQZ36198.1 hypothetical protein C2I18_23340 [Paenibacillus sp. PK3_47]